MDATATTTCQKNTTCLPAVEADAHGALDRLVLQFNQLVSVQDALITEFVAGQELGWAVSTSLVKPKFEFKNTKVLP